MKNLKIMHIVHSMGVAGVEKVVYDIVTQHNGLFEFSISCLDSVGQLGNELREKGIRVVALGRKPGIDFSIVRTLAKQFREQNIDIVHAHQYTPYFYGASAAIIAKNPKIIFTEHGRHQPDRRRWKRIVYNKFLNLFTDVITGVSEFSKDSLVSYEGFSSQKIRVIYNGIRTKLFDIDADVATKRKELGLDSNDKVIGIVARLEPVKNHRMLLEAFSEVIREIPKAKLLIVGDGQLRNSLQSTVRSLQLEKNVVFLGVRRDIPELLKVFDVFALSSLTEATSVTLLEAMASGLPVVVTNVGGNPEIVIKGKTGLLVARSDYKIMSKALIDILNNPIKAKEMGILGKNRIRELFTLDKMTRAYLDLYLSLSN